MQDNVTATEWVTHANPHLCERGRRVFWA